MPDSGNTKSGAAWQERFIGLRLVEAREARGKTATELAELMGVSKQTVHAWEKKEQVPRTAMLAVLAQKLGVQPGYFCDPDPRSIPAECVCYFRSLRKVTRRARDRMHRQMEWLIRVTAFASNYVDLPPVEIPECPIALDADPEAAEEIADHVREQWGLGAGPIANVTWLLENKGAVVARLNFGEEKFDGFSVFDCELDRPIMMLNADHKSACRSRFDAAHELGHMVMHRGLTVREYNRVAENKRVEAQAHRFANSFLFPRAAFMRAVRHASLDEFLGLKSLWRVSIASMAYRAADLGLADMKDMFIALSRRRWRRREPLDNELVPESPRLLTRVFRLALENQLFSAADVLSTLHLDATDIERVANISRRLLSPGMIEDVPISIRRGAQAELEEE